MPRGLTGDTLDRLTVTAVGTPKEKVLQQWARPRAPWEARAASPGAATLNPR